jgi:hypothetical protein
MELPERIQQAIAYVVKAVFLVAIATSFANHNYVIMFISIAAFILTWIPAIVRHNYRIVLPTEFELALAVFIYASLFLGEVRGYYTRFAWWDVLLHGGAGLALGFIGFLILYVLYAEEKVKSSPIWVAIFSFCFAVALGAVWEIFEFSMDSFFGTNMQKSGLIDTMWDLIVDCTGALITSTIGYFYIKGGKTNIFGSMIQRFCEKNPRLSRKMSAKTPPGRH